MSKVVVVNNVTLDGVMQAPGRPDEDTRGGFTHGGWAAPYTDAVMGQAMADGMTISGALLSAGAGVGPSSLSRWRRVRYTQAD